jgi:hypothetical protein
MRGWLVIGFGALRVIDELGLVDRVNDDLGTDTSVYLVDRLLLNVVHDFHDLDKARSLSLKDIGTVQEPELLDV